MCFVKSGHTWHTLYLSGDQINSVQFTCIQLFSQWLTGIWATAPKKFPQQTCQLSSLAIVSTTQRATLAKKWSLRHWQQLSKSEPGELVVACLLLLPRVLPFSHRCRLGVALITKNPNSTVKNFLSFSHAIDWFVENRNRKGQNEKSVELGNQLAAAQLTPYQGFVHYNGD